MTRTLFVLLAALSLPAWWRETNSHAASRRGTEQYGRHEFPAAVQSFRTAHEIAPSARTAFNLGTAEIAAGRRAEGATHLEEAIRDPAMRADALFNRGNGALAANALDHAVRDYIGALKANPGHAAAKRNLEIALSRRQSEKKSDAGGDRDQPDDEQKQQPAPTPGQQKPEGGEIDLEALLRSVQQQEQEELRRMKANAGEARVGW